MKLNVFELLKFD